MVSRYSIIQYVPNPIADERINIGIVAFNDHLVKTRFVKSWRRINCFAISNDDIEFLKDFQCKMQKSASLGLLFSNDPDDKHQNLNRLTKIAQSWNNSVQFTEPRGSLDDPETLLDDIAGDLLIEPCLAKPQTFRDRQDAVKITRNKIRSVINGFGEEAKRYYQQDYKLQGELSQNKFDVAVANGKIFLAAQAVSFEININELVIGSTSWLISDVKKMQPLIPIGVVMLPPKEESCRFDQLNRTYSESKSMYESLGAETICEDDIESWANDRLGKDFFALVS